MSLVIIGTSTFSSRDTQYKKKKKNVIRSKSWKFPSLSFYRRSSSFYRDIEFIRGILDDKQKLRWWFRYVKMTIDRQSLTDLSAVRMVFDNRSYDDFIGCMLKVFFISFFFFWILYESIEIVFEIFSCKNLYGA